MSALRSLPRYHKDLDQAFCPGRCDAFPPDCNADAKPTAVQMSCYAACAMLVLVACRLVNLLALAL